MNISESQHLFSSIGVEQQITASIDVFYIGSFIGLVGGILCGCVIIYFKYKNNTALTVEVILLKS